MSAAAQQLNEAYLNSMRLAVTLTGLARVRELWWPTYLERLKREGPQATLDSLDLCMSESRERLQSLASEYAITAGATEGSAKFLQLRTQFLKSNTGKMFERFVGLALAYALKEADAPYCIQPFRAASLCHCNGARIQQFQVQVRLGKTVRTTAIDADLIAFDPTNAASEIFMISLKSTLKDRFHSVPFWNLLRLASLSTGFSTISASDPGFLKKMRYVVICSDLAEEQPDFSGETSFGP